MDKAKVVPIVLLIIILGVGFVAYNFYAQNLQLSGNNQELREINSSLEEENSSLKQRYQRTSQENRELNLRLESIQGQLSQIERERNELREEYQDARGEISDLEERLKEKPQKVEAKSEAEPSERSGDYWADFVRQKAELEAKVGGLQEELLETQSKVAELQQNNTELSLKMDEMEKARERLEREIKSKQRALRAMSMDLVAEREGRGQAVQEVKKLRSENASLKQELIVASKQKSKLQGRLKETLDKKNALEEKVADAETILKEKSLTFKELQSDLSQTIKDGRRVVADESGSVELPPIVVKPESPGLAGLRGEIIAVNLQEQFVVFDLGESSGIRPGILLKVVRGNNEIATLEVIETRQNISAADIKEVVGGFDIKEGDAVISR